MVYRDVYHRPLNRVSDYQPIPPPPPRPYSNHSPLGMKTIQMHVSLSPIESQKMRLNSEKVHVHGSTTQNISVHARYPDEYPTSVRNSCRKLQNCRWLFQGHTYPPPYSNKEYYYPSPPTNRSYSSVSSKFLPQRPPSHCPTYVSQSTIWRQGWR
jgi:hypothetical protein